MTTVGGQAVLEGVMMRGPSNWAVAVRKPDGDIAHVNQPIDSPSAKMPRITGSRAMTCRFIGDSMWRETCAMSPSGLRTATDQFDGPRIMTPSRTA